MDVVDSKVAWLQYMGYYQAARITPCHGHLPYATHIYPPGTPGTRRQASQTRLRMFDIEEMGPNMAMDQLVPGPREIVSAGCFFSPPKKLRSFFIAFRSFLYLNSLNTSSTVFQYISIYFNIKIQLIQGISWVLPICGTKTSIASSGSIGALRSRPNQCGRADVAPWLR